MSMLSGLYLLAIASAILMTPIFFIRGLRAPVSNWRDITTRFALGSGALAGVVILTLVIRVGNWPDPAAPVGSMLGLRMFVSWGHLGVWIAIVALLSGLFARRWNRVVSVLSSALFVSFWLIGYMLTEAQ